MRRLPCFALLVVALSLAAGCTSLPPVHNASNALEFLYPQGNAAATDPKDVTLHLPLRVGIGFAPGISAYSDPIPEAKKQALLERIAAAFRAHKGVSRIEVVPSIYLKPRGSFENLQQIASSLGLDLMVLVSYDQAQFTESTRASWTYLTVVGPFLVEGEKNDTRTVMDAVIYDIPSRSLLFRAAGESTVKGSSSPLNQDRKRRLFAEQGFDQATQPLVAHLEAALDAFEEQTKQGTVRGPGTPAIALYSAEGKRLNPPSGGGSGGGGGGAFGGFEIVAALALALAGFLGIAPTRKENAKRGRAPR
ncbi:MAG TPA: rhombotarget lipoprotein [Thermoanaerobaculia bacterium]|jgi:rhombotail lipoprotein|nr:rhombotarget lipoprotein [Thermoanaerobaculia bacterium]